MEYYFKRYGDLELHRRMISDRWRTDAFKRAIDEVVRKSDVVLDLGTGTGVLAMLAAKAGAKRVYAIDQAEIAQTAANLVKANGFGERVKVFRGPAGDLKIEEKVDLIISEWLGHLAFVEAMLDDVILARDAHLAPKGRMMPSHVDAMIAPIDDPVLFAHDGPGYWREPVHGLDFSSLEDLELKQGRAIQLRVEPAAMLSAGIPISSLDLVKAKIDDWWTRGLVEFEMKRDGILNGFAGWFEAQLSPKERLNTGPLFPETHWSQSYMAFPPRRVKKGQRVTVEYALERDPEERRNVRLMLGVGKVRQTFALE
jgi:type I protein arginine methyltransferase